jgi:hypothetical protein
MPALSDPDDDGESYENQMEDILEQRNGEGQASPGQTLGELTSLVRNQEDVERDVALQVRDSLVGLKFGTPREVAAHVVFLPGGPVIQARSGQA